MSRLVDRRVLIFQQRGWATHVGHFLAKRLQAEGCVLGALTIKRQTHEFVVTQNEVRYAYVVDADSIKENPRQFLGDDQFELEEICRALGVDSIWPFVQAARNHVKSYRDKYYYGFKQNLPDDEIVGYVKAIYKNILQVFNDFGPELIVTPNFAGLQHVMFSLYAARAGVATMGMTDTKITGVMRFSLSHVADRGAFFDRLDELENVATSSNREKAMDYIQSARSRLLERAEKPPRPGPGAQSFFRMIRDELTPYLRCLSYLRHSSQNKLRHLSVSIDDIPPRFILRDYYAAKINRKTADSFAYDAVPASGTYVYFPLQVQPEANIDVHSPRFNNQIETARQVAMSLPDAYTLVVKNHPTMTSWTPPSYLRKVARTPNVKLVDYRVQSARLLKGARVVVSPSGTTLAEAAFLRVPSIQLGDLGTTRRLPNVIWHGDLSTLSSALRRAIKLDLDTPSYDERLARYFSAAYDTGVPFDRKWISRPGIEREGEQFWCAFKSEAERLLTMRTMADGVAHELWAHPDS